MGRYPIPNYHLRCPFCSWHHMIKRGIGTNKKQRYECTKCGRTTTRPKDGTGEANE